MWANYLYPAPVQTVHGLSWGYINNKGLFVIPPQYAAADEFQSNGLAVVQLGDLVGLINQLGQFVVAPQYSAINQFSESRAVVYDQQGAMVINEAGQVLTTKAYNYINSYHDGRAVFSDSDAQGNYLYGYLDLQGREVLPLQYQSAGDFLGGKAVVQLQENQYALININGEKLAIYNYAFVGNLGEGLLTYKTNPAFEGKYGYIDEQGRVVLKTQYATASQFQAGRAVVNISADFNNNQYGVIDQQGNFIIKPEFNDILYLGEGRFAVGRALVPGKPFYGSKYALATLDGSFLTDFDFGTLGNFRHGLASASGVEGERTFFLNRRGKIEKRLPIVPGSGTLSFVGELVKADIDFHVAYYTSNRQLVWQENTSIPLNFHYRVQEVKYKPNKDYLVFYPQLMGMADKNLQASVNRRLAQLSQVVPIKKHQQLDYTYSGNFTIEFFRHNLVVFELGSYRFPFGAAHGMPSEIYPHVDLVSGRFYQLKDLFKPGSNYVQVLSALIAEQIKNDPQYSYVFPDTYTGIKPDQPFYVAENFLAIYFFPYEIAPYAAGFPTFKIPWGQLEGIIDRQGAFWRSFH